MNERTIEHQLKKAVEASGGLCWKLVCPGTTGVDSVDGIKEVLDALPAA